MANCLSPVFQRGIEDRLRDGKSTRHIASELGISRNTVRRYRKIYLCAAPESLCECGKKLRSFRVVLGTSTPLAGATAFSCDMAITARPFMERTWSRRPDLDYDTAKVWEKDGALLIESKNDLHRRLCDLLTNPADPAFWDNLGGLASELHERQSVARRRKWIVLAILAPIITLGLMVAAFARGDWAGTSPLVQSWFQSLMVPGTTISCCGIGDGYPVAHWKAKGADFIVTLEDGRKFQVPHEALIRRQTNPTGRDILFIYGGSPLCFITGPEV